MTDSQPQQPKSTSNSPSTNCLNKHCGILCSEKARQILDFVNNSPIPVYAADVCTDLKINANTTRFYLSKLVSHGLIGRKSRGCYVTLSTKESSGVVGVGPLVHNVVLRFSDVGSEARRWVVDDDVVKCTFHVFGNGSATVFVGCRGGVSLDYPAFRVVLGSVCRELGVSSWEGVTLASGEFNYDFMGVKLDGLKGVTVKAFDGSFRRVYNKRFGLRDEVKVVGSRSIEDVFALMHGGVSQYTVNQFLFRLVQRVDALNDEHKLQNRVLLDAVDSMRRIADATKKEGS